jgi:hypothetical protein
METVPESEEMAQPFCIGQHETNRLAPVTLRSVQCAHASNVCSDCIYQLYLGVVLTGFSMTC